MKKIIYLGYVVPLNEADHASGASVAGNKMQWNVVKNLSSGDDAVVSCVTVTPYAAFPYDKMIFHKAEKTTLVDNITLYRVSYLNLPVVKQLWQIIGVYRAARKLLKNDPTATVLCFNLFPQIGIPMRWLKKKFPECKTVCLLADLPLDDNTNRKFISRGLRKLFDDYTRKNMAICDKYIVLNKSVANKYLHGKPFIVIDGGVDVSDIKKNYQYEKATPAERNIMYCGALTEYNGVLNLIEAMESFRGTDIYCDIYGSGYLEDQVRAFARENSNIRFHDRVDNFTVMQRQREAWLLINPRIINDPIAQVTFPSKTFEYLLSGTPVVSTRLNGYTEEYDGLMVYAEDDSPQALVRAIQEIAAANYQDYLIMAKKAVKFVIEKRNWSKQGEKVKRFIMH